MSVRRKIDIKVNVFAFIVQHFFFFFFLEIETKVAINSWFNREDN
jgi:hypothetical protein